MSSWKRTVVLLSVVALLPLVACGSAEESMPANEEPTVDEAPAEDVAAAPAADETMADETMGEPEADSAEPEEPQLVGNITLTGENFEWGETTTDSAQYTWTVTVSNDTTSNLDITVIFSFLDDSDGVIKTERATVRMAPATRREIRESGEMSYDEANRVYSFSARYDYSVVES